MPPPPSVMSPFRTADGRLLPPLPASPPLSPSDVVARAAFRVRLLGSLTTYDVLRWGSRKMFKYNIDPTGSSSGRWSPERRKRRMDSSYFSENNEDDDDSDEDNVGGVGTKIRGHRQIAVGSFIREVSSTAPVKKTDKDECPSAPTLASDDSEEALGGPSPQPRSSRPCNLTKRRSICGLPTAQQEHPRSPLEASAKNHLGLPRARKDSVTEKKKMTLQLILTKEEIYADFILMTGAPPPRKLKKRPAKVQRHMQVLYPEPSALCITADLYKVPEERGQRR